MYRILMVCHGNSRMLLRRNQNADTDVGVPSFGCNIGRL